MDRLRLLHRDSSRGYTDRVEISMMAEPEAITEAEQMAFSVAARSEFADMRFEENRRRDNHVWLERLRKAEMGAAARGIDIIRNQTVIRREILNMEQRLNGGGTLVSA